MLFCEGSQLLFQLKSSNILGPSSGQHLLKYLTQKMGVFLIEMKSMKYYIVILHSKQMIGQW
jgi:hypothetical protein